VPKPQTLPESVGPTPNREGSHVAQPEAAEDDPLDSEQAGRRSGRALSKPPTRRSHANGIGYAPMNLDRRWISRVPRPAGHPGRHRAVDGGCLVMVSFHVKPEIQRENCHSTRSPPATGSAPPSRRPRLDLQARHHLSPHGRPGPVNRAPGWDELLTAAAADPCDVLSSRWSAWALVGRRLGTPRSASSRLGCRPRSAGDLAFPGDRVDFCEPALQGKTTRTGRRTPRVEHHMRFGRQPSVIRAPWRRQASRRRQRRAAPCCT
jgi:hypothetical protein